MSYDHWKATNPADEHLGPDPDEEIEEEPEDCEPPSSILPATERQNFRHKADMWQSQIYVWQSKAEDGDPIWVYSLVPPDGVRCLIIGPSQESIDAASRRFFERHSCYRCRSGAHPCVQAGYRGCEFPHARND